MFGQRIRELRQKSNLTMKEFGKKFNLAESTISGYENEARKPDIDLLSKFADFFEVDIDYILGRTEVPSRPVSLDESDNNNNDSRTNGRPSTDIPEHVSLKHSSTNIHMSSFQQRFKQLREAANWTQDQVADKLGLSRPTIAGYESEDKNRVPREETLRKIADLFDVSTDYLLGRTNTPDRPIIPEHASPKDKRDFKKFLEQQEVMFDGVPMDQESKDKVLAFMEGMFWDAKAKNKRKKDKDNQ
ncbi:helix-turn-helix domain-containing protein [Paenibacillus sp. YYML68]|uniref:helix-turn-helix domain-containing protein n=1 Tax=Paenibacillus sp. YYML68 TaxID=2909250 RepID=UPI0024932C63|nr:helix-turn-helix domain-containing protein [Paenibacillus sp. YYML68]